jgi:tRNA dimethylallyltransferase
MEQKKVIVVAGPTASGKTALAVRLAQTLGTSIISADSRQCYKELDIGVAKPSAHELQLVHHYFISSHPLRETVNAAQFEQLALGWAESIFEKKDWVVLAGGTGLYIQAFCSGLDDIPEVDPGIRVRIVSKYQQHGLGWLQDQIRTADPGFYALGEILNPHRLIRALEVKTGTGQSILYFRKGQKKDRPFRILKLGLDLTRQELREHIDTRTDRMIELGLVEEVRRLLDFRELNALQTVGYREIIRHLDGEISLEEAIRQIKTNTWQYAKRQITWFKKDIMMQWVHPGDDQAIEKIIKS